VTWLRQQFNAVVTHLTCVDETTVTRVKEADSSRFH